MSRVEIKIEYSFFNAPRGYRWAYWLLTLGMILWIGVMVYRLVTLWPLNTSDEYEVAQAAVLGTFCSMWADRIRARDELLFWKARTREVLTQHATVVLREQHRPPGVVN